jgi:hypothetical protein
MNQNPSPVRSNPLRLLSLAAAGLAGLSFAIALHGAATPATPATPAAPAPAAPTPAAPVTPAVPAGKPVPFADVQPILKKYCYNCHGGSLAPEGTADSAKSRGQLALDTEANNLKGGRSGKSAFAAGKADESEAVLRMKRGAGARGKMPAGAGGQPAAVMAPEEIQKLVDWVNGGAQFK